MGRGSATLAAADEARENQAAADQIVKPLKEDKKEPEPKPVGQKEVPKKNEFSRFR